MTPRRQELALTEGLAPMHDPIAYTYEADHHCPDCTLERFGVSERGFIAEESEDDEGNPVGAIFPWDEWHEPSEPGPQSLVCSDCGAVLDTVEPDDDYADDMGRCPACGSPIDYCQGHGPIGDPAGFAILEKHDADDHSDCHPDGCDEA